MPLPAPRRLPSCFPLRRTGGLVAALGIALLHFGCDRTPPAPAAKAATAAAPAATTPPPGAAPATAAAPAATTAAATAARQSEKDRARQNAIEKVPVETAVVVRGPISSFLSFNTTLETEAAVDIYPQTTGQVETLFAEEGRIVKAGDPLLKIEDSELRLDAEESRVNFEQLQRNFGRSDDLFNRKLVNKQDHETQNSSSIRPASATSARRSATLTPPCAHRSTA